MSSKLQISICFSLKHLEETPNAMCSALNPHEFMEPLIIFSFLLDTNTKETVCELNMGLLHLRLQRHTPLPSIILAFKFQIYFIHPWGD